MIILLILAVIAIILIYAATSRITGYEDSGDSYEADNDPDLKGRQCRQLCRGTCGGIKPAFRFLNKRKWDCHEACRTNQCHW